MKNSIHAIDMLSKYFGENNKTVYFVSQGDNRLTVLTIADNEIQDITNYVARSCGFRLSKDGRYITVPGYNFDRSSHVTELMSTHLNLKLVCKKL